MAKLTEHKNKYNHYYTNDRGRYHGEYKWWDNGQLRQHCFYKDGELHGEYKWRHAHGQIETHRFFKDNYDMTAEVKALVDDISNLTHKEKVLINLKFGIDCISEEIKCHN